MNKWKGKNVLFFRWREFYGYYPCDSATVLEETEEECLIKINKFFGEKIWTFKNKCGGAPMQISGFCKLLKT